MSRRLNVLTLPALLLSAQLTVVGLGQGSATAACAATARESVIAGRVLWRGGMFEHWVGSIDEVRIYQGAVTNIGSIS